MNRTLILGALVALLSGCGGGGGGLKTPGVREVVTARQDALMRAFKASDATGFMALVSETYSDDDGAKKPDLAKFVAADFAQYETLSLSLDTENLLVSPDGQQVEVKASYRITDRDRSNVSDTLSYVISIDAVWSHVGSSWLVTKLIKPVQVQSPQRRFL